MTSTAKKSTRPFYSSENLFTNCDACSSEGGVEANEQRGAAVTLVAVSAIATVGAAAVGLAGGVLHAAEANATAVAMPAMILGGCCLLAAWSQAGWRVC